MTEDKPVLKRYLIVIQHEIIVYGYEKTDAEAIALKTYSSKETKCLYIRELPPVEVEAQGITVIDNRSAPGQ